MILIFVSFLSESDAVGPKNCGMLENPLQHVGPSKDRSGYSGSTSRAIMHPDRQPLKALHTKFFAYEIP